MTDLTLMPMRAASEAVRTGQVSPVALTEAYLARIAEIDSTVRSYILVLADAALAAARIAEMEIEAGKWRGPLHGLPFAVKDNYFSRGVRTCANSRVLMEHVPAFDATILARLHEAGAILLGKLNTWEYGTSMGPFYDDLPFPPARNPWDLERITGGSSTGAGASVPARTALFALGSDTGGSVRLPAAACGLQGLKPTYGLVSRYGILPNCWAFDTAGPLCWNVWDCAAVLQAIAGHDASDPTSAGEPDDYLSHIEGGVEGLTIGYIADLDCNGAHPDQAILTNLAAAAAIFARAGATIVPMELPAPVLRYRDAASVINWSESYSIHEHDFRTSADKMGQALRDKMMAGLSMKASDYLAALRERRVLADANAATMRGIDLLLAPGAFHVAPKFADPDGIAAYTGETAMTPFNISSHPAISLCSGFDADGMPTNIQLVGQWFGEATLLRAAYAYEQATPWRETFPQLA